MTNYDDLPLFPLHLVLYPEMPLPLHIFEPRYREMIYRCREESSPFGIVLIRSGGEAGQDTVPHSVGTTARLTQHNDLPDGRMDIWVIGETRFRILETRQDKPYLSARVEPLWHTGADLRRLEPLTQHVSGLFKTYLRSLFALINRPLSALQLPLEPESLSYAIASVLQIPQGEKQRLLEMTTTELRLQSEIEMLSQEIDAQNSLRDISTGLRRDAGTIAPANARELSKLSSRN